MKQLATLSFSFLPLFSIAQCDLAIPSSAPVISTDGEHELIGAQWVCDGLTVTLSSSFVSAFVEVNANVTANTNLGIYAIRAGGTLTINGFNNNVYHDPSATIIDNGTNNFFTVCPGLAFDYSDAPNGGCDITAALAERPEDETIVYPNPAHNALHVQVVRRPILGISRLDMSGRMINARAIAPGELDLSGAEPGQYVVLVRT